MERFYRQEGETRKLKVNFPGKIPLPYGKAGGLIKLIASQGLLRYFQSNWFKIPLLGEAETASKFCHISQKNLTEVFGHPSTKSWWDLACAVLCLVTQSCLTVCNPMDCSPPGSSVHGILQARILEGVAMPSSRGSSRPRNRTKVSCIAGRFFTS